MQIEEYNPHYLNLTEFIEQYNLNMILNNEVISKLEFELDNYEQQFEKLLIDVEASPGDYIYYSDVDLKELTAEELKEAIFDYVSENVYTENYQYFIIPENDVFLWEKYTNYDIFYNDDLNLYLLGISHRGMSWSFFFTTKERLQHQRIKKYDEILGVI